MRVEKNCKACGALINVRLADHRRGWGNFCDKACSAAYKCAQRPKDVNRRHAKSSVWAADRMAALDAAGLTEWPKARSIADQIGGKAPKIRHKLHSPRYCKDCGNPSGGDYRCMDCEAIDDSELGWDGHKS